MNNTLIYLHGFNSASVDAQGQLLPDKHKLQLLAELCRQHDARFLAPNLDYTNPAAAATHLVSLAEEIKVHNDPCNVVFIGTSLGGFMAEYVAMQTHTRAIMINPAVNPSQSLRKHIGACKNYVTAEDYAWSQAHCDHFKPLEKELMHAGNLDRTLLIDRADEVLDSAKTIEKYQCNAEVHIYPGGCHRFAHLQKALPIIAQTFI